MQELSEKIQRIRGMKDILPEEAHIWRFVEWLIHSVMATYGYREIRTPALEATELFVRSIGGDTDLVDKQMYTFKDRGGRSLTLRPELTAPVVRAYIQEGMGRRSRVTRLYYLDVLFRQERPQAGRLRQFHQFGVEALGSPHPEMDIEVIALAYDLCNLVQPKGLTVRVNTLGAARDRPAYLRLLREALAPHAGELSELERRRLKTNPLRIFDSQDPETQTLLRTHAPKISDHVSSAEKDHFGQVQAGLIALGIPCEHDPNLVRGLDYYTGTTFELVSTELGAQDSLCGGGRYDNLVSQLGGSATPAIGFAAGMERLFLAAGERLGQRISIRKPDVYLVVLGKESRLRALSLAQDLRAAGYSVLMEALRRSAKAQLREANRSGARVAAILGEEELSRKVCSVKRMDTGEQVEVALEKLGDYLDELPAAGAGTGSEE